MKSLLFKRYGINVLEDDGLTLPDHRVIAERSARAKRMALRVDNALGVIKLVIPEYSSQKKVQLFIDSHHDWIEEQLAKLLPGIPFEDGTEIPILGSLRTLHIVYSDTLKKTSIELKNKDIVISTNKQNPNPRLERYFKALAKETLEKLSHNKAKIIRKNISKVSVKDTKSRWGSCSSDKALCYSWRLIFAPYEAMDYVVAHEVAHLQHLDHSKAFWNVCSQLSNDYVEGKYWMRNHGQELMRYGRI